MYNVDLGGVYTATILGDFCPCLRHLSLACPPLVHVYERVLACSLENAMPTFHLLHFLPLAKRSSVNSQNDGVESEYIRLLVNITLTTCSDCFNYAVYSAQCLFL